MPKETLRIEFDHSQTSSAYALARNVLIGQTFKSLWIRMLSRHPDFQT
jgi:hypothetical protein